ncbi:hypothetical protein ACET3Z_001987 [Daucus carota]
MVILRLQWSIEVVGVFFVANKIRMLIMLRRGMDSRVKSDTIVLVLNLMDIGQVSLLRGSPPTTWYSDSSQSSKSWIHTSTQAPGIQLELNMTRIWLVRWSAGQYSPPSYKEFPLQQIATRDKIVCSCKLYLKEKSILIIVEKELQNQNPTLGGCFS